jgi:hypothetical protein
MPSEYEYILDTMPYWSYSRLNTFERCHRCFYLQYILGKPQTSSDAFSEYGKYCHSILEKYGNGELKQDELATYYRDNYNIKTDFIPYNKSVNTKYFEDANTYFSEFNGYGFDVLAVEQKYNYKIGEHRFLSIIDIETPDAIVDNKTRSSNHTKKARGADDIQLTDGRHVSPDAFRQLYIYSIPYHNKYGRYPERLCINMIRSRDWYETQFEKKRLEQARQWVLDTIDIIYDTDTFNKGATVSGLWCNSICGMRGECGGYETD